MTWLTAIPGALKLVPRWLWYVLAAALAYHFALSWHAGKVDAFGKERFAAGAASRDAEITGLRLQLDARSAELAATLRSKHDEELRRIAADADDLRLRGPGKAACTSVAFLPAGTGGHVDSDRPGDASVDPMRDAGGPDLIALPFAGTVSFGEQHDAFRTEALAWREWHRSFTAEWAEYQKKAAEAAQRANR